jgi:hypothetical protein
VIRWGLIGLALAYLGIFWWYQCWRYSSLWSKGTHGPPLVSGRAGSHSALLTAAIAVPLNVLWADGLVGVAKFEFSNTS